eukprot:5450134-Prorocentrum_lima.AAC.1
MFNLLPYPRGCVTVGILHPPPGAVLGVDGGAVWMVCWMSMPGDKWATAPASPPRSISWQDVGPHGT